MQTLAQFVWLINMVLTFLGTARLKRRTPTLETSATAFGCAAQALNFSTACQEIFSFTVNSAIVLALPQGFRSTHVVTNNYGINRII